jgi:hypothetical protein
VAVVHWPSIRACFDSALFLLFPSSRERFKEGELKTVKKGLGEQGMFRTILTDVLGLDSRASVGQPSWERRMSKAKDGPAALPGLNFRSFNLRSRQRKRLHVSAAGRPGGNFDSKENSAEKTNSSLGLSALASGPGVPESTPHPRALPPALGGTARISRSRLRR